VCFCEISQKVLYGDFNNEDLLDCFRKYGERSCAFLVDECSKAIIIQYYWMFGVSNDLVVYELPISSTLLTCLFLKKLVLVELID